MLYNVAQLLKENIGASRQFEIDGLLHDLDEGNPDSIRVRGNVVLLRTMRGILATAQAHLRLKQACRRCLELVETQVCFQFEEEFLPLVDIETGAQLAAAGEDCPELAIDEHHVLDLTEVLRQYAVMATCEPPLCSPECKGICSNCGHNLNLGPCHCSSARADPRFAVLAELLKPTEHPEEAD